MQSQGNKTEILRKYILVYSQEWAGAFVHQLLGLWDTSLFVRCSDSLTASSNPIPDPFNALPLGYDTVSKKDLLFVDLVESFLDASHENVLLCEDLYAKIGDKNLQTLSNWIIIEDRVFHYLAIPDLKGELLHRLETFCAPDPTFILLVTNGLRYFSSFRHREVDQEGRQHLTASADKALLSAFDGDSFLLLSRKV